MESTTISSVASEATASSPVRLSGATSYAVLSVASLCINVLLASILLKNHHQYRRMTFFVITWQLLLADVLTQLMQLIVAVPLTFAGIPLYGEGLLLHCMTFIDTVAYYGTLFFSFLMTANRVMVFLLPQVNQVFFGLPNVYRTIVIWWLVVFVAPISLNAAGCYKNFETNGYYLYHACATPISKDVYTVWYNITTYTPVAMIVMYALVFFYLRYVSSKYGPAAHTDWHTATSSYHESARRRREQRLLLQSFLICGSLEMQNLAFNYLPLLGANGQWAYAVYFLANWISIVNNSMTAIVMFAFNNDIRARLAEMFGMRKKSYSTATTVLPMHTLTGSSEAFRPRHASLPAT
ncbi:hypothetical protein AAVH_07422 [Aphelenchoides avenae]|nr:hypothetical protein AAVH_07422 [Aphelenchus avenae]